MKMEMDNKFLEQLEKECYEERRIYDGKTAWQLRAWKDFWILTMT